MPGETRKLSNVSLLASTHANLSAGLLRDSMNDPRVVAYKKTLDRKGKNHCEQVGVLYSHAVRCIE